MAGPNQMLPNSIAAFFGWISISDSQPVTTPVLVGRVAQTIGSCVLENSATKRSSAAISANGP